MATMFQAAKVHFYFYCVFIIYNGIENQAAWVHVGRSSTDVAVGILVAFEHSPVILLLSGSLLALSFPLISLQSYDG